VRFQPWLSTVILFLILIIPSVMKAQLGPNNPDRVPTQTPQESEEVRKLKKEMAKKANEERQAEIQRDTEKLLKLATELKEYVGKTNENILSVDVVKKADEIEKLAHDVKEKMKNSY
jgi:nitric oxide reductase activation protein